MLYIQLKMSKLNPNNVEEVADTIAGNCVAMRVRYLNRSVTSIYDDAFRPLGITASQVNVLVAVIKQGMLSPGQLGNILNIEKSTLSRNLERMRKAGWIEIIAPNSGRTHTIQASKEGKELLLELLPLWRKAQDATDQLLDADGSEALRKVGDHAKRGIMIP